MTESTLPSGSFKPTKKLPSSYSRPAIEIGGGKAKKKREWRYATPLDIQPGDIIADLGVVQAYPPIEYSRTVDILTDEMVIKVRMSVGEHGPLTFDSTTSLKAFM